MGFSKGTYECYGQESTNFHVVYKVVAASDLHMKEESTIVLRKGLKKIS